MSVKQSLLAILDQGPCYGYQLRAEFERRTGATWPLNVGQIYSTLDRLERDGMVLRGDADDEGHVYWSITDAGSAEVLGWLNTPVQRATNRDELAIKIAVAATLPGIDIGAVIHTQRRASIGQLQELNRAKSSGTHPDRPEEMAWSLVVDSMIFAVEAEVRWLDHTEQRLALRLQNAFELELAAERPKRGRPRQTETGDAAGHAENRAVRSPAAGAAGAAGAAAAGTPQNAVQDATQTIAKNAAEEVAR